MKRYTYDLPTGWLQWMILDAGLPVKIAEQIVDTDIPHLYRYFEKSLQPLDDIRHNILESLYADKNPTAIFQERCKITVDFILGEISRLANKAKIRIVDSKLTPSFLSFVVLLFHQKLITAATAKYLIGRSFQEGLNPLDVFANESLQRISNPEDIKVLIYSLCDTHLQKLEEYSHGNAKLGPMLIGHLMKISKGCADAELLNQYLEEIFYDPN